MNKEQSMYQKKMNLFLRVLFIFLIIAILGAAILQIFAPEYMGRNSAYGISMLAKRNRILEYCRFGYIDYGI